MGEARAVRCAGMFGVVRSSRLHGVPATAHVDTALRNNSAELSTASSIQA